MKKLLILCFILVSLSGCQKTKETDPFVKAIQNFDIQNTYGFQYDLIVQYNQQDYHLKQTVLKLNMDERKAITSFYEKMLAPFEADALYTETTDLTYFNNNQKGVLHGEEITWSSMTIDDYLSYEFPITTEDIENLTDLRIVKRDSDFLGGRVKDTSSWTTHDETIEYIDIEIIIRDGKLMNIRVQIKQVLTTTVILFTVFDEPQTVLIP